MKMMQWRITQLAVTTVTVTVATVTVVFCLASCQPGTVRSSSLLSTDRRLQALEETLGMDPSACLDYLDLCELASSLCLMADAPDSVAVCANIKQRCDANLAAHCDFLTDGGGSGPQPDAGAGSAPDAAVSPSCGDQVCASNESCASCPVDCGDCPPLTLTVAPEADSYVNQGSRTRNYGKRSTLLVDRSPDQQTLLRFAVTGLADVRSARLRLYVVNRSSNGPAVHRTSNSWSETAVTWNNRPQPSGAPIVDLGSTRTGWLEIDVSSEVRGSGLYSFVLIPGSSDGFDVSSREGSHPPELLVEGTSASNGGGTPPQQPDAGSPPPPPDAGGGAQPDAALPPACGDGTCAATESCGSCPQDCSCSADPIIAGAGDIACEAGSSPSANYCRYQATSDLLVALNPTAVFTLGDNSNTSDSTAADYLQEFDPTWGRFKAIMHPTAGNHDYHSPEDYYAYFGSIAGPQDLGYYSYDLGGWHLIALNSNLSMSAGSAQELWLRADLAAHAATKCTLAYWHAPRFSSGDVHGSSSASRALWQALYDFGAELVLSGHDHIYERFAPQTANGTADPARGIRQFVVGTGGMMHYSCSGNAANSEVCNDNTFGVLALTLRPGGYDWRFIPEAGKTFTDSGSESCH